MTSITDCYKFGKYSICISDGVEHEHMGKEERKHIVLTFMAEHQLALPPKAIFRNLRLHQNITFSERSVANYLDEFVEQGLVARVEPKSIKDRELVEVQENTNRRTYYIVTDEGIDQATTG